MIQTDLLAEEERAFLLKCNKVWRTVAQDELSTLPDGEPGRGEV